MAATTDKEIRAAIAEILKGGDLSTLSSKKVRRQLEEKFDEDFSERKKEIDSILMEMITASQSQDAEKNKNTTANSSENESSGNDLDLAPEEKIPIKKKQQKPINKKKNIKTNAKNNKSKSKEETVHSSDEEPIDDEELARRLQEEENDRGTRTRAVKKVPIVKKRKPAVKKERKGTSKYSQKCLLSEELTALVGESLMARHDVVKKMWQILRERNLIDPKNRQYAFCDDQLIKIFGKKRFRPFGMMRYLKSHIKDSNLVTGS